MDYLEGYAKALDMTYKACEPPMAKNRRDNMTIDPDTQQVYTSDRELGRIEASKRIMEKFEKWAKELSTDYSSMPPLNKQRLEHHQTVIETIIAARAKLLSIVREETGL